MILALFSLRALENLSMAEVFDHKVGPEPKTAFKARADDNVPEWSVNGKMGAFSPDDRWLAYYSSGETGQYEVWVRSFPDGNTVRQITVDYGHEPFWCQSCGFSYILSISGIRWLGAVTPIGGVALLVGWVLLFLAAAR